MILVVSSRLMPQVEVHVLKCSSLVIGLQQSSFFLQYPRNPYPYLSILQANCLFLTFLIIRSHWQFASYSVSDYFHHKASFPYKSNFFYQVSECLSMSLSQYWDMVIDCKSHQFVSSRCLRFASFSFHTYQSWSRRSNLQLVGQKPLHSFFLDSSARFKCLPDL